jgi:hypothetical protein
MDFLPPVPCINLYSNVSRLFFIFRLGTSTVGRFQILPTSCWCCPLYELLNGADRMRWRINKYGYTRVQQSETRQNQERAHRDHIYIRNTYAQPPSFTIHPVEQGPAASNHLLALLALAKRRRPLDHILDVPHVQHDLAGNPRILRFEIVPLRAPVPVNDELER